MISIHTCEFTLQTNYKKFNYLLSSAYKKAKKHHRLGNSTKYKSGNVKVDEALGSKGITIEYHNYEYRKMIKVIANPSKVLGGNDLKLWKPTSRNIDEFLDLLNEYLEDYFDSEYELNDFLLTRIDFTSNFKVGKTLVPEYISTMHKLGKVTKFKPKFDKTYYSSHPEVKETSFDLIGKTNHIEFTIYDKESDFKNHEKPELAKKAKGILRSEVRLSKRPAIKESLSEYTSYTNLTTEEEFTLLALNSYKIFLKWFIYIIPYGHFHTLKNAEKIVSNSNFSNPKKKKMLRLLRLISEKKSLYLAVKELNTRNISEVIKCFEKLDLSPITISKHKKISSLPNLYDYIND